MFYDHPLQSKFPSPSLNRSDINLLMGCVSIAQYLSNNNIPHLWRLPEKTPRK